MSNLRDKAREIREQGEAERNNFEPSGAPLRLYNYWLKRSSTKDAEAIRDGRRKENFCHFWRVVVFWAPFMWFRRGVVRVVEHPATIVLIVLAMLAAAAYTVVTIQDARLVAGIVAGVLWTVSGLAAGAAVSTEGFRNTETWEKVFLALTLPVSLVGYAVGRAVVTWTPKRTRFTVGGLLTAAALLIVGMIVVAIVQSIGANGFWLTMGYIGLVLLAAAAGLALMLGAGFAFGKLGELIGSARRARKAKALEAYEATLDDEDYYYTPRAKREPGKVAKFFTGVGDFLVFLSQIIRVNKWKICPLVTVDKDLTARR